MTQPDKMDKYEAAFQPLPGAPAPVSLMDLAPRCCKWPVGDKPVVFCGLHAETGRYCEEHERMSGAWLEPLV